MQQGTESERTEPYWLAHHVHLALCGHHAVLMDLRRNRYLAVQPAMRLSGWIGAWPLPAPATLGSPPAVLGRLIEHGMLVCERGAGHAATPISIESPQRTLLEFDFDAPPRPNGRDLRRAAWACAAAASSLKLRPMYAVLEQIRPVHGLMSGTRRRWCADSCICGPGSTALAAPVCSTRWRS